MATTPRDESHVENGDPLPRTVLSSLLAILSKKEGPQILTHWLTNEFRESAALVGWLVKGPRQEQGIWKGPPPFKSLLLRAPRVSSMAWRWPAIVEVASHPPVSQIKPSLSTAT